MRDNQHLCLSNEFLSTDLQLVPQLSQHILNKAGEIQINSCLELSDLVSMNQQEIKGSVL